MSPVPVHQPESSWFEVVEPEGTAVLTYVLDPDDDVVTFEHSLVPPELEGRGIASALTRAGLAWAAQQHLAVVPRCPFVRAFVERHPDEVHVDLRPV